MIAEVIVSALMAVSVAQVEAEPTLDYLGTYQITAYSYEEGGGENYYTAGGYEPIPWYTCAAPYDVPMGTILYIEDFGEFQVQDRGAFPSYIIDVHVGYDDPDVIGLQEKDVYIVRKE